MKNILILLSAILLSHSVTSKPKINKEVKSYSIASKENNNSIIYDIEKKIYVAFINSIINKNNSGLNEIENKLEVLNKEKKQNIIKYWIAYLKHNQAVFYLTIKDRKNSEKKIDEGIYIMENINKKNSEDYALLAKLLSFSIQFKGMKAPIISRRVKESGNLAISLDSMNLRAYQVLGINNFYTPKQFGGGKLVEKYLNKAISLPNQKIENKYLPSWGKDGAYEYLIRFYIRIKDWDKAKRYYKEAISLYPKNYMLNKLASELTDK